MSLIEQLIRHEGLRLRPYIDTVGKLTIGVGRNLTDIGISEDEAMLLLRNDLLSAENVLRYQLPWVSQLDQQRLNVLINMTFNLGIQGLLKFRHTLEAVRQGDWNAAADQMLSGLWARQVKGRAVELAETMRTGVERA